MSGSGRKTGYRKSVAASVLDEFPVPTAEQEIVKVIGSRGANIFEVQAAGASAPSGLAMLPNRFSKMIWVKRGNHVIVEVAAEAATVTDGGALKIRYMIQHVLFKDQIKHLRKKGLWPAALDGGAGGDGDGDGDGDGEDDDADVDGGPEPAGDGAAPASDAADVAAATAALAAADLGEDDAGECARTAALAAEADEDLDADPDMFVNRNGNARRRVCVDSDSSDDD